MEPVPTHRLEATLAWMERTLQQWSHEDLEGSPPDPDVWGPYITYLLDTYMENAWETLLPWPDAAAQRWSLGILLWGLLLTAYARGPMVGGEKQGARSLSDAWALVGVRAGWSLLDASTLQGLKDTTLELALWLKNEKPHGEPPLVPAGGGGTGDNYYTHSLGLTATWWGEMAAHWTGLLWGAWVLSLYPMHHLVTPHAACRALPEPWIHRLMTFVHERFHTSWKKDALWLLVKPHERWLFHWRTSEKVLKDPYTLLTTFRESPQMNSLDERLLRPATLGPHFLKHALARPSDPVHDAWALALLNHLMRVDTKLADWKATWVRLQHDLEREGLSGWEKTPWPMVVHLQGEWFLWSNFRFIHTQTVWEAWALWVMGIDPIHLPSQLMMHQTPVWELAQFILNESSMTRLPTTFSLL